jgi:UDP-N-acetylmuramoyl-tripeptide--D-alanyl-D-alanine ligase
MRVFEGVAAALASIALAIRVAGRQHRLLHLLQIEHYEPSRLLLWLRRRKELLQPAELFSIGVLYVAAAIDAWAGQGWVAGVLLLLTTPIALIGWREWSRPATKPLVFTPRAKRLFTLALVPSGLVAFGTLAFAAAGIRALPLSILLLIAWLLLSLSPYVLLAANLMLAPVERAINRRYVKAAKLTLRRVRPLRIGITGSYGKTSTKFCVDAVLSADRLTLVTPASFNSYLGVVRTINEHLRPEHKAFVAEMGMFRRRDIAELCELVSPQIGVITAIGPMHLERLGSIEQIEAAKAELMEALPADGRLITNGDDPRCLAIADKARCPVTLFAIDNAAAEVRASGIAFVAGHTELDIALSGKQVIHVSAQLLGRHNVYNMLAAAAVGEALCVPSQTIASALSTVKPPQHRLSPIRNDAAGVIVIDDAYNSNPDGAAAALEVLSQHEASRRLLVTPGMVELGDLEHELNRQFGEQAAAVCDVVVLVGAKRTKPILEGLLSGGIAEQDVHVVADLDEATSLLGQIRRYGDVILFENDLPDTYAEDRVVV